MWGTLAISTWYLKTLFQFHQGLSRATKSGLMSPSCIPFQFHQGLSINRLIEGIFHSLYTFNSIKDYHTWLATPTRTPSRTFNSIKDYHCLFSGAFSIFLTAFNSIKDYLTAKIQVKKSLPLLSIPSRIIGDRALVVMISQRLAFNSIKDYPILMGEPYKEVKETFNSIKDYPVLFNGGIGLKM